MIEPSDLLSYETDTLNVGLLGQWQDKILQTEVAEWIMSFVIASTANMSTTCTDVMK